MTISRFLLFMLLLGNGCFAQQLITFNCSVKYNTMGLDDQIDVTYYCEGDSVSNFHGPLFHNFNIIEGPRTAQSLKRTFVNGKETEKKSLVIYYVVKPADTGSLTIEPATIVLNNGSKILSNPITVKVLPGTVANTLNGGNHETRAGNNRELQIAMLMSHLPFVVCAGPVYVYDTSAIKNIQLVINNAIRPLLTKDPANKEQGVYWDHDIPRLQVAVKDTAGLRDAIAALYPKDDKAVYLTTISQPTSMMFAREWEFDSKNSYYEDFERVRKKLVQNGADTMGQKLIVTTWSFKNAASRKQFKRLVKRRYKVETEDDFVPKVPHRITFKEITISRSVKIDDVVLREMAARLMSYADACGGEFQKLANGNYLR